MSSGTDESFREKANRQNEELGQNIADAWAVRGFDAKSLAKMTAGELAGWPLESGRENPARRKLAEFEWQRRLVAEQVKWMKWSVVAAVLAALLGAALGYILPKMFD